MSKDTCIKANTYCPVHKGIVGADCWHDSKDFSVPRTDWKQVDEINTLREQVKQMKAELKSIDGALDDPRANLTLTTSEIIWELKEQVEKLTKELDNVKQVEFPRRVQKVTDALKRKHEKELAALAEQNGEMKRLIKLVKAEENEAIIAAANALENIASTSSSTRIRRVANDALTAIRARRKACCEKS